MGSALTAAGLVFEDGNYGVPGVTVDVIGAVCRFIETNETDEDGLPVVEQVCVDGWHINIYTDQQLDETLARYEIEAPATPYRVKAE